MALSRRRGISNFIAVLLLMVLAVSAGAVIYAYTMGYLGSFSESKLPGEMSLDSVKCTTVLATIYIRNVGKGSITIDKIYLDGVEVTTAAGYTIGTISEIIAGGVGTITFGKTSAFIDGKIYAVKLVAKDNTQILFNMKCTA